MKQNKWDKLNKELDDALEAEFGTSPSNILDVFENAKLVLREHLIANKEEVVKDLEQMREWSNTNKQETLEEAAENYVNSFEYGIAHPKRVAKNAFINGAKQQAERMYSEEDLRKAFENGVGSGKYQQEYGIKGSMNFEQWFEQFKKK
jgi:hypothetical protein